MTTIYQTVPEPVLVVAAAKIPTSEWCFDRSDEPTGFVHRCNRRKGHRGRHMQHWLGGCVRAVWGDQAPAKQGVEAAA